MFNKTTRELIYPVRRFFMMLGGLFLLSGCGDVGGAGQCFNVEESGICLTIDSLQPKDEADNFTGDADVLWDDCDGDGITDNSLFAHSAEVQISARLQEGVTVPPAPAFVTWTNYSVLFSPNANNLGSSPPLTGFEKAVGSLLLETEGSVTADIELIPLNTKAEYVLLGGDTWPQNYTATVTLQGKDQFNEPILVQGTASVNFGDFLNCASATP